ncbi:unnamed protein product [Adineta steineri]|uniref:Uncharacterized protein n=1 Tax=Adineta steineri TaxID=433720 RepID=A0A813VJ39_9BILA|nr:unnamed protein product [Adineta steineri]CAF1575864.1 unnamed protein product [Adineta steineri]
MTTTISLMLQCTRLNLTLPRDIIYEYVEYILKHIRNIKDLFLWDWSHLLDTKKRKSLLSIYCPKLLKLDFICTGNVNDDDFDDAEDNFEQDGATIRFWIERNDRIIYDGDFSAHDYRDDIVVRFNIQKNESIQKTYC